MFPWILQDSRQNLLLERGERECHQLHSLRCSTTPKIQKQEVLIQEGLERPTLGMESFIPSSIQGLGAAQLSARPGCGCM